jgi:WhiB family redox-sensing transcriptional regulator
MTKCPQVIAIVKNAKSVQLNREQLVDLPILDGARCSDPNVDPDLWFPDQGQSIFEAKAICSTCPAFNECLTFALGRTNLGGIWGGATESERISLQESAGLLLGESDYEEGLAIIQMTGSQVASTYDVDARTVARWKAILRTQMLFSNQVELAA